MWKHIGLLFHFKNSKSNISLPTSKYFLVPQQASPNLATVASRRQCSLSWQYCLAIALEATWCWQAWFQENTPKKPSPQMWAPLRRPKFAHTTSILRLSGHSSDILWFSHTRALLVSSGVIRPIHLYLTYRNKIYTMRLLMLSIKTSSSSFRSLFEKVHDTQLVLSFSLRSDESKFFVQVPMQFFLVWPQTF